jgi:hypothetical protein
VRRASHNSNGKITDIASSTNSDQPTGSCPNARLGTISARGSNDARRWKQEALALSGTAPLDEIRSSPNVITHANNTAATYGGWIRNTRRT